MPSAIAAFAVVWLVPPSASAATYDVGTPAELQTAIASVSAGSGGDTINITGDITLSAELSAITKGVTITGNGHTVDGASTYRIFFIAAGSGNQVNVSDLTLANGFAKG